VLVVLGVFGALVWPHLGSKWRPGAEGRFASPEQRAAVIAAWGNRCAVCDADGNAPGVALEIDHIVPYALGGKTDTANFQPLCGPCNRAKGKLSMQEFMRTDYYRRVAMSASY
jgi:5-methylcytosine-specific restriction endonuclease McrA